MGWSTVYIAGAGTILDLLFGAKILKFDEKDEYLLPIPAMGGGWVPIEEILFYVLGGLAIILVYFWADEHWLEHYTVRHRRALVPARGRLVLLSGPTVLFGSLFWGVGFAMASFYAGRWTIPLYYTFIVLVAILPAVALFRNVKEFVNWRAFSFTGLWVLLTSCLWEVTLALKLRWWGYQNSALIGVEIKDWGTPFSVYPLEALLVWLVVTFSCVLTYEAVKAYQYDPRPGMRTRFFG
jgi:hypothetical protein